MPAAHLDPGPPGMSDQQRLREHPPLLESPRASWGLTEPVSWSVSQDRRKGAAGGRFRWRRFCGAFFCCCCGC